MQHNYVIEKNRFNVEPKRSFTNLELALIFTKFTERGNQKDDEQAGRVYVNVRRFARRQWQPCYYEHIK